MRGAATATFLVRGDERLALLADDVHEIAHREVDVDEVKPPARVDLTVGHDVAGDVVDARIGGVAVHRHLQIRPLVIGDTLGRQQTRAR